MVKQLKQTNISTPILTKYERTKVISERTQQLSNGSVSFLKNPESYIQSNIVGFLNIIENCRKFEVENFIDFTAILRTVAVRNLTRQLSKFENRFRKSEIIRPFLLQHFNLSFSIRSCTRRFVRKPAKIRNSKFVFVNPNVTCQHYSSFTFFDIFNWLSTFDKLVSCFNRYFPFIVVFVIL